jgi:hypothetical protein
LSRRVLRQYTKSQLEQIVKHATLKQVAAEAKAATLRRGHWRAAAWGFLAGWSAGCAVAWWLFA